MPNPGLGGGPPDAILCEKLFGPDPGGRRPEGPDGGLEICGGANPAAEVGGWYGPGDGC